MHDDNAPSHAIRNTSASISVMGIKGEKFIVWHISVPDFNLYPKVVHSGHSVNWGLLRTFGASVKNKALL